MWAQKQLDKKRSGLFYRTWRECSNPLLFGQAAVYQRGARWRDNNKRLKGDREINTLRPPWSLRGAKSMKDKIKKRMGVRIFISTFMTLACYLTPFHSNRKCLPSPSPLAWQAESQLVSRLLVAPPDQNTAHCYIIVRKKNITVHFTVKIRLPSSFSDCASCDQPNDWLRDGSVGDQWLCVWPPCLLLYSRPWFGFCSFCLTTEERARI